jgi:hypothetical protein
MNIMLTIFSASKRILRLRSCPDKPSYEHCRSIRMMPFRIACTGRSSYANLCSSFESNISNQVSFLCKLTSSIYATRTLFHKMHFAPYLPWQTKYSRPIERRATEKIQVVNQSSRKSSIKIQLFESNGQW